MRRIPLAIIGSAAFAVALTAVPAHAATGPEQTHITAKLSTGRISIGQSATLSGRLEADDPSGWQPLANRPVDIYFTDAGQPSPVHVTTDAQGDYSYEIKAAPGSLGQASIIAVFNNGSNPDPAYSATSSPSLTLGVPVTRSFSGGQTSSDSYGNITLSGSFYPDLKRGAPVSIQYSPNGKDHWKQMKLTHADQYGYFRGTAHYSNSGYWRARYVGDADNYPAVAYTYKNWRWNTHFTSFKAARSGSKVAVKGTLVRYFSATHVGGFAHQTVEIIFRFKGKKTWYLLGKAKTDSKGRFSTKVKHYGAGSYLALFQGTSTTWASESPKQIYVRTVPADEATSMDASISTGLPLPPQSTWPSH